MDIADILEKEKAYLSQVEEYRDDVESRLSELKDKICEKIDELIESKCNTAADIATRVQENIDILEEGDALSRRTESLSYDLEICGDKQVDDVMAFFVTAVGNSCGLDHKTIVPTAPAAEEEEKEAPEASE